MVQLTAPPDLPQADGLDPVDRDALTRAMEIAARDPDRAEQLQEMLAKQPWVEVAEFAAYVCQCRALGLKPGDEPPCAADPDDPDDRSPGARLLLRKMLHAGVSRYEPDPAAALARRR